MSNNVQSMPNAALPVADKWLRDVSIQIIEFQDDSVDVRIYVAGELLTRKLKASTYEAALEIGAAIYEEAK